jgi:hypothetical protein
MRWGAYHPHQLIKERKAKASQFIPQREHCGHCKTSIKILKVIQLWVGYRFQEKKKKFSNLFLNFDPDVFTSYGR